MKTVRAGPRGWWSPAGRTTLDWKIWRQTPTISLRSGATTLQDTAHPASASTSAPRNPVCCALKHFCIDQQGYIHIWESSNFFSIIVICCYLPAPSQAPRIIGKKLKGHTMNIAWEIVQPLPNEASVDGYKVSTVSFTLKSIRALTLKLTCCMTWTFRYCTGSRANPQASCTRLVNDT